MVLRTFTNLFTLLMVCSLLFMSCSKELDDNGDGGNVGTEEQLPANKAETQQKIKGKWNVSASGEVRSIEFLNEENYVLEVNASSSLVAGNFSASSRLVASLDKRGSLKAATSASNTNRVYGKFTISADGKQVVLDGVATITIKKLTSEDFEFSIKFEDQRTLNIVSNAIAVADTTSKTNLLARTWLFGTSWTSSAFDFSPSEIAFLTQKGFKAEDNQITFTQHGTFIESMVSLSQAMSNNPQDTTIELSARIETYFGTWRWKNSQQAAIVIKYNDDSEDEEVDLLVSNLTKDRVSIYNPVDSIMLNLIAK